MLSRINGLCYCALHSEDHKVSTEVFKAVPFAGADLTVIQEQEVSSEDFVHIYIKNACIFLLGYYLFLEAHGFLELTSLTKLFTTLNR